MKHELWELAVVEWSLAFSLYFGGTAMYQGVAFWRVVDVLVARCIQVGCCGEHHNDATGLSQAVCAKAVSSSFEWFAAVCLVSCCEPLPGCA